ncbi:MAG TPA: MFS transporter [Xanthobacteraceae bacterium]|nr:MFS transporter [Xanthobacteraceae bacterium]
MTPPSGAAPNKQPRERKPAEAASAGENAPGTDASSGAAAVAPPRPPARMSHAEVRKIFFGVMLTVFLAALNQTVIATALPTIGRHFYDFENLSWVVTAYLLTSTAVAPLYGKLSDIYGRRAVMLAATGIFMAGSAVCAAAPNMLILVLGRGLQGIGGGGILPVAQSIIADVVAPRERGRYQAYMGVVWVTSGVGGPVLGGALAEHLHWSLIFWLNVPLGLLAAWLTQTYLKRIPRHERRHALDILGALLMMASAIPLLLALSWGGVRYAWLSPVIVTLIAASFVLSFAFAWRLVRAPEPFLPLAVLNNPVMRMGTLAAAFAMATSIALTIFTPLYFEVVHKLSATDAGLALIPLALTTPGSLLSGRAMLYGRHYKWVPMAGLACAIAALAVLVWKPAIPLVVVIVLLSVVGTAIGTCYPVTTVSIQNAVATHQVGVAMGALNFFRSLASAFGVAVMGAIILAGFGAAPERGASVSVLAQTVGAQGFDAAGVFRWVFFAALLFLGISLLALYLMEERPLRSSTSGDPQMPAQ